MKTLKLALSFVLGSMATLAFAQPTNFKAHGVNSSDATVGSENIDSVTVTGVYRYAVQPDSSASNNPDYHWVNQGALGSVLTSTFDWSNTDTDFGTPQAIDGRTDSNIVDFLIAGTPSVHNGGGASDDSISVQEISGLGGGCTNGDETRIAWQSIAEPEAGFDTTTVTFCNSTATGQSQTIDLDLFTQVGDGVLTFNLDMDGPSTANVLVVVGATQDETENDYTILGPSFADGFGTYTVNITAVSDRISRKATDGGASLGLVTNGTYTGTGVPAHTYGSMTIVLNQSPTTGSIFHLPNM